jgi:hypothetical protein
MYGVVFKDKGLGFRGVYEFKRFRFYGSSV